MVRKIKMVGKFVAQVGVIVILVMLSGAGIGMLAEAVTAPPAEMPESWKQHLPPTPKEPLLNGTSQVIDRVWVGLVRWPDGQPGPTLEFGYSAFRTCTMLQDKQLVLIRRQPQAALWRVSVDKTDGVINITLIPATLWNEEHVGQVVDLDVYDRIMVRVVE